MHWNTKQEACQEKQDPEYSSFMLPLKTGIENTQVNYNALKTLVFKAERKIIRVSGFRSFQGFVKKREIFQVNIQIFLAE